MQTVPTINHFQLFESKFEEKLLEVRDTLEQDLQSVAFSILMANINGSDKAREEITIFMESKLALKLINSGNVDARTSFLFEKAVVKIKEMDNMILVNAFNGMEIIRRDSNISTTIIKAYVSGPIKELVTELDAMDPAIINNANALNPVENEAN